MIIIALEGPSFSGKTSLIGQLTKLLAAELSVAISNCYVDEIVDVDDIPPARSRSAEEQLRAFRLFMDIEAERTIRLSQDNRKVDLVILDRSVDTLLAHTYAVDQIFGFDTFGQAIGLLPQLPHMVPDMTFYLDAPPATLQERQRLLGQPFDLFLLEPAFVERFRTFFTFDTYVVSKKIHFVDAEEGSASIADNIVQMLSFSKEDEQ